MKLRSDVLTIVLTYYGYLNELYGVPFLSIDTQRATLKSDYDVLAMMFGMKKNLDPRTSKTLVNSIKFWYEDTDKLVVVQGFMRLVDVEQDDDDDAPLIETAYRQEYLDENRFAFLIGQDPKICGTQKMYKLVMKAKNRYISSYNRKFIGSYV